MTADLTLRQRMLGDGELASCLRTRRQLQRVLDGEADPPTAAAVGRHLDACARCGGRAQTYRDIVASLRDHAAPPPARALRRLGEFAAELTEHHR